MLTTSFSRIASTRPITQAAQFSSIRTRSTPTSMSSPSTFMIPGEPCLLKLLKANMDDFYMVFFHVPYVGVRQLAGSGKDNLSTVDEAFSDNWADVCGFLRPLGSQPKYGLVHEMKRQPRKYEDTTSSLLERHTSSGNPGLTIRFFDLVDLRKFNPKNYLTGRWVCRATNFSSFLPLVLC